MSRGRTDHEPVEQRLRDALEARAYSIGLNDLRPAAPPTVPARSALRVRRTVVVLFGLAAALACVILALTQRHPTTPPPARAPTISPTPTPTSSPSPLPSASAALPGAVGAHSPLPSASAALPGAVGARDVASPATGR
jgi:hypothetical protein